MKRIYDVLVNRNQRKFYIGKIEISNKSTKSEEMEV